MGSGKTHVCTEMFSRTLRETTHDSHDERMTSPVWNLSVRGNVRKMHAFIGDTSIAELHSEYIDFGIMYAFSSHFRTDKFRGPYSVNTRYYFEVEFLMISVYFCFYLLPMYLVGSY